MTKNPSGFYDEGYLKSPMSSADLSVTRWEDNGIFYSTAISAARIADTIDARSVLDVGCGRGFVVRHLVNMGYLASGLEYGSAALAASVCRADFCDLTTSLPCPDSSYELVICHGVLSHIPEESVPNALSELFRVAGRMLWANILTMKTPTQQHHRTFRPAEWWIPRFKEAGFSPSGGKAAEVLESFEKSLEHRMFLMEKR